MSGKINVQMLRELQGLNKIEDKDILELMGKVEGLEHERREHIKTIDVLKNDYHKSGASASKLKKEIQTLIDKNKKLKKKKKRKHKNREFELLKLLVDEAIIKPKREMKKSQRLLKIQDYM